jgi:lipoprotein NlpI
LALGPAQAAGYDDFASGLTANVRGDPDAAVAAFTAALKSGALDSAQTAASYRGRAAAYYDLRQCAAADGDLKTYATMRTLNRESFLLRARIRACLGDGAGAKADWATFAGDKPGPVEYLSFAQMMWGEGLYAEAHSAMLEAVGQLDKAWDRTSIVLWYAAAAERAGKPDPAKLADLFKNLDTRDWPAIVLKFYLGKATKDQVLERADSWLAERTTKQLCVANFYLAEWYLAHNDVGTGKALLSDAAAHCPRDRMERAIAADELKLIERSSNGSGKAVTP